MHESLDAFLIQWYITYMANTNKKATKIQPFIAEVDAINWLRSLYHPAGSRGRHFSCCATATFRIRNHHFVEVSLDNYGRVWSKKVVAEVR